MIRLTRLNGSEFSLNPDLIHRAEETPDTVLTLIDGSRYVVEQGLEELIDRIVGYRARVVAAAGLLAPAPLGAGTPFPDPDGATDGATGGVTHDVANDGPDPELADVVRLRSRRA